MPIQSRPAIRTGTPKKATTPSPALTLSTSAASAAARTTSTSSSRRARASGVIRRGSLMAPPAQRPEGQVAVTVYADSRAPDPDRVTDGVTPLRPVTEVGVELAMIDDQRQVLLGEVDAGPRRRAAVPGDHVELAAAVANQRRDADD